MTHIDGEDFSCAVLEQAIGETTSRRSDVEHNFAYTTDSKTAQGSFQLEPAAADIAVASGHGDLVLIKNRVGRLCGPVAVNSNFAGHDSGLCLLPRGKEAPLNERLVEPHVLTILLR